jgi:hypothetical protein
MTIISEGGARNGKYQTLSGRLVVDNIIKGLTTGDDPKRTFVGHAIAVWYMRIIRKCWLSCDSYIDPHQSILPRHEIASET